MPVASANVQRDQRAPKTDTSVPLALQQHRSADQAAAISGVPQEQNLEPQRKAQRIDKGEQASQQIP